jgi:hypothetical protein
MDGALEERYRFLFHSYGRGEGRQREATISELKSRIIRDSERLRHGYFRPDAAFFLLVNLDQMIIRPYFEPLYGGYNRPLPIPEARTSDREIYERDPIILVERILNIILERIKPDSIEGQISGHAVMRAIDMAWGKLSDMLGWA